MNGEEKAPWRARLARLRRARADPARVGDAAVLQSRMLGGVMSARANQIVRALAERHGEEVYAPRIDFAALARLPSGTFGRAVAEFCEANAIVPATISDEAREDLEAIGAAARYICLHDVFHVVLDTDTTIPGELLITAFILEQGYFRRSALWLRLLYVVGPLARPWRARRALANIRRGRALARRVPTLLGEPLERWFDEPLEAVRARLRVTSRERASAGAHGQQSSQASR